MVSPLLNDVDRAIAAGQDETAVKLLEILSARGELTGDDEIALSLLLMWPPIAAWDESLAHLQNAIGTPSEFEATIWGDYICLEIYPVTEEFHQRLSQQFWGRAEAQYLIAEKLRRSGDCVLAHEWISRAITLDPFPNALLLASKVCRDLAESHHLLMAAKDRVENQHFELSSYPINRRELRRENWKARIRGELLTSHQFDAFYGCLFTKPPAN